MVHSEFLRQFARTRRFTLGTPQQVRVCADGRRVLFTRSAGPADTARALWMFDVDSGAERLLADPARLGEDEVPETIRRLQERSRDFSSGITDYATDAHARLLAFGLGGRLWTIDLEHDGQPRRLDTADAVVDPRPSPNGEHIAYVSGGELRVVGRDGNDDRALATPEDAEVGYGLPEYVAAEDMHRLRGYWWSPAGDRLLVARVDERRVASWHLSDPERPLAEPRRIRYPTAGTANAEVTLSVIGLDGDRVDVAWDTEAHEYLLAAHWDALGPVVVVQSRDHSSILVQDLDPRSGSLTPIREDRDAAWVKPILGVPARTDAGELVWATAVDGSYRLLIDGEPVTPDGLQVRDVRDVDGDTVLFRASDEPSQIHLWSWTRANGLTRLTDTPGVHDGTLRGGTLVTNSATLDAGPATSVRRLAAPDAAPIGIASRGETPVLWPVVRLSRVTDARLPAAVLFPSGHRPGSRRLPVLVEPYGGPAGQRVLANGQGYLLSQWFADHGFAVVIADGRGTPGRGPAWDRTIHLDKAKPPLDDQITALHAVAEAHPDLDLSRVAIRGWSYGGFLAAQAVLRRPDVFHAASAGAAPTDARWYNTYYQERYLGHPDEHPEAYADASLVADAPKLRRPLLLIHGLVDDNVHPVHVFALSAALQRAGREHTVLGLPGTSHAPLEPAVVENLRRQEAAFLCRALGMDAPSSN